MTTQLSSRWRERSISDNEWDKVKKMVLANPTLLTLLDVILEDMEETVTKEEATNDQYETPSWAFLQAHRNGQKNVLKELRKLTQHLRK